MRHNIQMQRLVACATAIFVLLVTLLHFLRPDVDPVSRGISRYAAGPHGYLASLAFAALVVACAIEACLLRSAPWAIAAVGLAAVIVTPLGLEPSAGAAYAVHQAGALVFFIAAAWASRDRAVAVCLVLFLATVTLRGPWLGLLQRALFAAIAAALLRFGATPESPSPRARARP